jgi:hypothetical protein
MVRLIQQPRAQPRTFHLAARETVSIREIKDITERLLAIDGVTFAGPDLAGPTALEGAFIDHVQEYLPYLHGDPVFDCCNRCAALPHDPPPRVDAAMLERLVSFAAAADWGRAVRRPRGRGGQAECVRYLEGFFPDRVGRSSLARVPLNVAVGLDVADGGQWSYRWQEGRLVEARRGSRPDNEVVYGLDRETFTAVVSGRLSPQEAFFSRRIDIAGDLEMGLKLAVLFGQFVREFPFDSPPREGCDVGAATG